MVALSIDQRVVCTFWARPGYPVPRNCNPGYVIIMIALFLVVGCVILLPIGYLITIRAANSIPSSKPQVD